MGVFLHYLSDPFLSLCFFNPYLILVFLSILILAFRWIQIFVLRSLLDRVVPSLSVKFPRGRGVVWYLVLGIGIENGHNISPLPDMVRYWLMYCVDTRY